MMKVENYWQHEFLEYVKMIIPVGTYEENPNTVTAEQEDCK